MMTVDRLLMVFDMRFFKKMTPLQLTIDPMFLRFIPTYSNRLGVVSQVSVIHSDELMDMLSLSAMHPWMH
jgi:PAB-dependent poly(A)-specific ribonuclease subunit 2